MNTRWAPLVTLLLCRPGLAVVMAGDIDEARAIAEEATGHELGEYEPLVLEDRVALIGFLYGEEPEERVTYWVRPWKETLAGFTTAPLVRLQTPEAPTSAERAELAARMCGAKYLPGVRLTWHQVRQSARTVTFIGRGPKVGDPPRRGLSPECMAVVSRASGEVLRYQQGIPDFEWSEPQPAQPVEGNPFRELTAEQALDDGLSMGPIRLAGETRLLQPKVGAWIAETTALTNLAERSGPNGPRLLGRLELVQTGRHTLVWEGRVETGGRSETKWTSVDASALGTSWRGITHPAIRGGGTMPTSPALEFSLPRVSIGMEEARALAADAIGESVANGTVSASGPGGAEAKFHVGDRSVYVSLRHGEFGRWIIDGSTDLPHSGAPSITPEEALAQSKAVARDSLGDVVDDFTWTLPEPDQWESMYATISGAGPLVGDPPRSGVSPSCDVMFNGPSGTLVMYSQHTGDPDGPIDAKLDQAAALQIVREYLAQESWPGPGQAIDPADLALHQEHGQLTWSANLDRGSVGVDAVTGEVSHTAIIVSPPVPDIDPIAGSRWLSGNPATDSRDETRNGKAGMLVAGVVVGTLLLLSLVWRARSSRAGRLR